MKVVNRKLPGIYPGGAYRKLPVYREYLEYFLASPVENYLAFVHTQFYCLYPGSSALGDEFLAKATRQH